MWFTLHYLFIIFSITLLAQNLSFFTQKASAAILEEDNAIVQTEENNAAMIEDENLDYDAVFVIESGDISTRGAAIIEVDKPIAYQGYLNNYKLGQMANLYDKQMTWLSIVNTIIFAGGVTSPAGVANSLASAIGSSPSKLRTAYDKGQYRYVVSVYANGVKPSLSKKQPVSYP
ncbi:hypothetical protein ACIQ1D_20845 [Lysinibacillus xylanilyticus]|uniref:hypothetical protein n=1 Tax=Lysinibacillus xylanilyticus TaxID=582475 RepID=UPI00382D6278